MKSISVKNMSIKKRMTLWYVVLMLIVTIISLGIMFFVGETVLKSEARSRLEQIVTANTDEIDFKMVGYEVDDDFIFYSSGVYALVYDAQEVLISGKLPQYFVTEEPFIDGELRTLTVNSKSYYLYDRKIPFPEGQESEGNLWVRGVVQVDEGATGIEVVMVIMAIALPLLVLIAAIGGYAIAKRSLRPIEKMNDIATDISSGKDLSRRIDLGDGNDELHELAETFNNMLKRIEESFATERQFTSDASHELRTPIAVILAQCEYVRETATNAVGYREAMQVIERQAIRMSHLISELLNFTRMEQQNTPLCLEPIALSDFIETNIDEMRSIAKQKNIEIITDLTFEGEVKADIALLTRLLTNLIDNALKYGHEGGHVWIQLRDEGKNVSVSIRDDGIGIAASNLPHIWQRFWQADTVRSSGNEGSRGLGLAFVRQIAHMHEGDVEVISKLGEGSEFIFRMPKN